MKERIKQSKSYQLYSQLIRYLRRFLCRIELETGWECHKLTRYVHRFVPQTIYNYANEDNSILWMADNSDEVEINSILEDETILWGRISYGKDYVALLKNAHIVPESYFIFF